MCFLTQIITFNWCLLISAVKYEAKLEDGTLVSKSDGVEFAVKDG